MKRSYSSAGLALCALSLTLLLVSCNKDKPNIPEPKPGKEGPTPPKKEEPVPPKQEEPTLPTAPMTSEEAGKSNVVAMDFTGQLCPACPGSLAALKRTYEEFAPHYIAVALHSDGRFYSQALHHPDAAIYHTHLKVTSYPTGRFNNVVHEPLDVRSLINLKDIYKASASIKLADRKLDLELVMQLYESERARHKEGKINLVLWVIENNIISYQRMPSGSLDRNFKHNFVFRGSLNGVWGEKIELGKKYSKQYTLPIYLNPEHCELIVLLMDSDTKRIIDATSFPLQKKG